MKYNLRASEQKSHPLSGKYDVKYSPTSCDTPLPQFCVRAAPVDPRNFAPSCYDWPGMTHVWKRNALRVHMRM